MSEGESRKELASAVVEYLSKEIETTINTLTTFRTKIAFAVMIGPFLGFGSFLVTAKGNRFLIESDPLVWLAIGFEGVCFLTIAYVCARIEGAGWRRCDQWRETIVALHGNPSLDLEAAMKKIEKRPSWNWKRWTKLSDWLEQHKIKCAYLVAYFLIFASFVAVVFIISKVKVMPDLSASPAAWSTK